VHPMRTSRYLFSETFNPWMRGVALLADEVAKDRQPLARDHPSLDQERKFIAQVSEVTLTARETRDKNYELMFDLIYGPPMWTADRIRSDRTTKESEQR